MTTVLYICLILALLVVLVLGLRKRQLLELESNIDNDQPLPPLTPTANSLLKDLHDEFQDYDLEQTPQATTSILKEKHVAPVKAADVHDSAVSPIAHPDIPQTVNAPEQAPPAPEETPLPIVETHQSPDIVKPSPLESKWSEVVNTHKKNGDLESALRCCQQAYPLWNAFNQSCIVLREQIRHSIAKGEDYQAKLKELYFAASLAELLHDKTGELSQPDSFQLKHRYLPALLSYEMPYRQIGYMYLRLARKTDIRWILDAWGEPTQHSLPREHHQQAWKTISENLKSV